MAYPDSFPDRLRGRYPCCQPTPEILVGTLVNQDYALFWIWFWATAGNTLGSVVNGIIGRQVDRFKHKRWFPVSELQLHKARNRFNRYGQWSLLLGWLPIGGDALTLVGGDMRRCPGSTLWCW